jgi:hypothetical protein
MLELKEKTSMAQTASQAAVYAKGLNETVMWQIIGYEQVDLAGWQQ